MKQVLFCVVATFILVRAHAQQNLSLKDAINIALKNSLDIQLSKNTVSINAINNDWGIAGALPTVTGTLNDNEQLSSINQQYATTANNVKRDNVGVNALTASITGSILLYNGQRVITTKKRLEALKKQSEYQLNQQIQNTLAGVAIQYFDIIKQQYFLKTIQQSLLISQKKLDILNTRKNIGLSNNAEVFQAQVDLNNIKQSIAAQQLIIAQGKTTLLGLLFLKGDSLATPYNIIDTITVDSTIDLNTIQKALQSHPAILASDAQIGINKLIEKETALQRFPSLRLNTGYTLSNTKYAAGFTLLNQNYGPYIGLNLNVPIYNGGTIKKQEQIAAINTKSAVLQKESALIDYETNAIKAYQSYKTALEQLKTAQENYQLAIQLTDLVLQRFQLNQATIIDVTQTQQTFENAAFTLVNLNYAAKIAEIQLKQLAGQLAF